MNRGVLKNSVSNVQDSTGGEKSHKKAKNMNQKLPQSHEAELRSDLWSSVGLNIFDNLRIPKTWSKNVYTEDNFSWVTFLALAEPKKFEYFISEGKKF